MTQKKIKIETAFTKQFNVKYPIIAAPMFLVSTTKLVTAVCNAGGVGSFPALNYRPTTEFRKAVQQIKKSTDGPFGVNIIVQKSNKFQSEQMDVCLEEKVPLLITSLGSPKEIIKLAHQTGTRVYCDVVNLEHAKKVADSGADGLIAVGSGAGGHAGDISAFALIPYLVRETKLPVVAAGSIVDGAGMVAAFGLGASAIYMGTRFIASFEAEVDEAYKQTIVSARCEDIISTDKVDGFPGNFILTPALQKLDLDKSLIEEIASKSPKIKKWIALSRAARSLFGNPKSKASYKTVYSAGQGVGLIDKVKSVRDIICDTVAHYEKIKAQLP
ncbi:MAG: hypothetical protein A2048_06835 [Deltaproteobacteria bacterium GWA2_45_12]|nr:MAG: hypothetical protein A2048_06835 [Deltaproteobacteria bacterium GWA2_45_12]